MGTAQTIGVVLGELGDLAETVAGVLGHSTAGAVVEVASLVLYDAAKTAHTIDALELERIRQSRAAGTAAGQGAWTESHQDFARRCGACGTTIRTCNLTNENTPGGGKCCPDCNHPKP